MGRPWSNIWTGMYAFVVADEGSGTVDLLQRVLTDTINETEAGKHSTRYPEAKLRSREECHYHRLFLDSYENTEAVFSNVARWADRPV